MVRFSDLLGRGDDDRPSRPATTAARDGENTPGRAEGEGDRSAAGAVRATPNEPAPNEPVPPAPNEPVPPPPSSTPDDQLERLAAYASSIAAGTPEPPAEADQEPAAGPEHEQGFAERLGPVDDDLLPRRGRR